jgi:hypothetical protein
MRRRSCSALRTRSGTPVVPPLHARASALRRGGSKREQKLSAEEFAAAWAEGLAMSREQVVRYALEQIETGEH